MLQKAVRVGECCVQDNMFSVADLRDQLAEETGYYVAMNRVNGDFAFQETKRVVDEVTVIQNGAAQTHDFNRGISRVPIPFVFVYCKNIYNIV